MHHSRRSIFTMSNSAVSSFPAFLRQVPCFLFTAPPNRGVGGAPGGASLEHVALVKRDATLARRGPSRATGRPPLGAPPWRCRPGSASIAGIAAGAGAKAPRNRTNARPRPRRLVSAGYEPRSTPLPAPPSGSSPETPLMSEDESVCNTAAVRSQPLFVARSSAPMPRSRRAAKERDELAALCMSGKQHSEGRRGFGHDRLPVATGSPQALRIPNRE